jgi:phage tail sheath protein FI
MFKTSLGADDSARRAVIVQALNAIINSNEDIRSEQVQYNLVLCPGYQECTTNLVSLVTQFLRSEVFVIGDTPMNVDPAGLSTWAGSNQRVIDTAGSVAYYYPHCLTTNLDGATILLPSSAYALRTYAFSDNVSYQWFAPAGLRRGVMTGLTDIGYVSPNSTLGQNTTFVELYPNQGQRDVMYAYTATGALNPLVFFPGNGFVVWGQKTSTGTTATSVDRVNVSRLVRYITRTLRQNTLSFVFEPNDSLTRNNLKAVVDNFLGDLVTKRGLYDFASVCDSSNNTPDVIDNNQMIIDVAIKPVKAAEFIFIPITIVATGASLTQGGAAQPA